MFRKAYTEEERESREAEFERIRKSKNPEDKVCSERSRAYFKALYEACGEANLRASKDGLGGFDFCEVNLSFEVKEMFDEIAFRYIHDRGWLNQDYPHCSADEFLRLWRNMIVFIKSLCEAEREAYLSFAASFPFESRLNMKPAKIEKAHKKLSKAIQSALTETFVEFMDEFTCSGQYEKDDFERISAETFLASFEKRIAGI